MPFNIEVTIGFLSIKAIPSDVGVLFISKAFDRSILFVPQPTENNVLSDDLFHLPEACSPGFLVSVPNPSAWE